jgi:hypothetical protein
MFIKPLDKTIVCMKIENPEESQYIINPTLPPLYRTLSISRDIPTPMYQVGSVIAVRDTNEISKIEIEDKIFYSLNDEDVLDVIFDESQIYVSKDCHDD